MTRSSLADHQPHDLSSDDTLVLWRCDEALATDSFVDAGPDAVTLVDAGNPPVAASLFNSSPTSGARTFNGATRYGLAAAHTAGHEDAFTWTWGATFGGLAVDGGVTVEAWIKPASLAADMVIVEFGEYDSGAEAAATNVLISAQITTAGEIRAFWESGIGANRSATSSGAGLVVGTTYHVAIVVDDDPTAFDLRRVTFYVNGEIVSTVLGVTPPAGGSSSRWCIGASPANGAGVGTPGAWFNGTIDDVRVSRFAATPACVRTSYARGVRDFDEDALAAMPFTEHHVRVLLEDKYGSVNEGPGAGELIDMTTQFGWNWVIEGGIEEDSDSQTKTASVKLIGRIGEFNLSPFAVRYVDFGAKLGFDSPWNGAGGTNFDTFIGEMRRIQIEVATVPWGTGREGAAPYFRQYFDGFVKTPSVEDDGRTITLSCQDRGCAVQDVWIEPDEDGEDRTYGTNLGTAVQGELQDIINDNDPATYFALTIDDTGGGGTLLVTLFSTTAGVGQGKPHLLEVGDSFKIQGTAIWDGVYTVAAVTATTVTTVEVVAPHVAETVIPLFLLPAKSYLGGRPVLWVDTSPAWNVREWAVPATQNVMTALEEVMTQLGWRVGFRWDDHRQCDRLAIWRPGVSNSGYVEPNRLVKMGGFSIDSMWPRNVLLVEYESTTTGLNGERLRRCVAATTPATSTLLGRRYARVAVGAASNINLSGEGQELADNIADDLDSSVGDVTVDVLWDWRTEPGDYFFVHGEQGEGTSVIQRWVLPQWISKSASWGCKSISRSFRGGSARTTLHGRTSVGSAHVERHFDLLQGNGWVQGKGTLAPVTPTAPTCTILSLGGAVRGVWVQWQMPVNALNRMWDLMDVHINTVNGFTPSAATLAGSTRGENMTIAGLAASTTYYCRVIARDRANNVSANSAQATFTTAA